MKSCSTYSLPEGLVRLRAALGGAAAETHRLGPGGGEQRRHAVGVVAVGMGDEDVGEPPLPDVFEDGLQVRGILRAGIDQRQVVGADDIGVGALEGEGPGLLATMRTTPGASSRGSP